jgi:hypothetical protein
MSMPTPTGTGTFVDSGTDHFGERFSINDTDDTIHQGHMMPSLTEEQFRDVFKSRGISRQEIDDLVTRARQPKQSKGT